ncbi:hypothetical protein SMC26_18505 [Actinomadura fulvescens]|uniref:XRE family transcriptional regulator n=1 Tax=Actinomadura fulvescens TaxID=46160 RepID=A0ABP6CST9_9ACTN
MTRKYAVHPPRDEFAALLRAFHRDCGRPRYRRIVAELPLVLKAYPQLRIAETVSFSKSAISEILNGRRHGLPDPIWVACFVLCCQRLAAASGRLPSDPGRSTLPRWQAALRKAEDKAERLGLPVRHGCHPSASPSPPAAVPQNPAPVQSPAWADEAPLVPRPRFPDVAERAVVLTSTIQLSEEACEHVASFGDHARGLLAGAMARDPEAVYQVAILLSGDRRHSDAAIALLMAAAATRHHLALVLLQESPRNLNRRLAVAHAHELARLAAENGDHIAAVTFYECAARVITPPSRSQHSARPPT